MCVAGAAIVDGVLNVTALNGGNGELIGAKQLILVLSLLMTNICATGAIGWKAW